MVHGLVNPVGDSVEAIFTLQDAKNPRVGKTTPALRTQERRRRAARSGDAR